MSWANPGDVERLLLDTAAQDGRAVRIGFGQDPGQAGKSQALHLVRALRGFTVEPAAESGDPFSSVRVGAGQSSRLAAPLEDPKPYNRNSADRVLELGGVDERTLQWRFVNPFRIVKVLDPTGRV